MAYYSTELIQWFSDLTLSQKIGRYAGRMQPIKHGLVDLTAKLFQIASQKWIL